MSVIKIEVTGVSYSEARELAALLEEVDGVASASAPYRTRDHAFDPNRFELIIPELKAAAEAHPLLVTLASFLAAEYASGAIKEMGKEHYLVLNKRILQKLGEWRESKTPEQRQRITFLFDDEGHLKNAGPDHAP